MAGPYSLKSTVNDKFFEKFHYLLSEFLPESAKEILFVFCFDVWPGGSNNDFTSNKPTRPRRLHRVWSHSTNLRVLFRAFEVISRQLHRECWPSNAQLSLVCLGIILFFNPAPHKILQRCQIAASWWLIVTTISNQTFDTINDHTWDMWQVVPFCWSQTSLTSIAWRADAKNRLSIHR